MSSLYLLLPVHNRRDITQKFLVFLKQQTFQDYHLVLIDDGSTDGTATLVKQTIPTVTVLQGRGDWWWAGALQHGYLWLKEQNLADNSVILIMNDDTEFEQDFLQIGFDLAQAQSDSLLMAECHQRGRIGKGTAINWWQFKFRPVTTTDQADCFCTSALFLQWKTFKNIGGFYPKLLPHYISDYEFTYRAKCKGIQLITNPELKINWDNENTGHHNLDDFIETDLIKSIKKLFSKKSAHNPITFTIFIWLACPWYLKPLNLFIVWIKALAKICYITLLSYQKKKYFSSVSE